MTALQERIWEETKSQEASPAVSCSSEYVFDVVADLGPGMQVKASGAMKRLNKALHLQGNSLHLGAQTPPFS